MFPADAFQAQYLESREAAAAEKRMSMLQQQQQQQQRAHMLAVSAKLNAHKNESQAKQSSQQQQEQGQQQQQHGQQSQQQIQNQQHVRPQALGQAFMQRPNLSRSTSSQTVLGNILQGFGSRPNMQRSASGIATPVRTPLMTPNKNTTQAELEAAMLAERKRDADICAMPVW
jgi:ATPase subunit of ABC transporter with duplicated ATPase domains